MFKLVLIALGYVLVDVLYVSCGALLILALVLALGSYCSAMGWLAFFLLLFTLLACLVDRKIRHINSRKKGYFK